MAVNFTISTRRVDMSKGQFFDVRGMNTEDFTYLTTTFLEDMKAAVAEHGKLGRITKDRAAHTIMEVAKGFPTMVAEIISRCADAPDRVDDFRNLPFPVVIKALKEIVELTVEDGGVELGNLLAAVAALLETNGLSLGPLGTQLNDIIGSVEKTSVS